jgi:hypothetical protein
MNRGALRIAAFYAGIGGLWILFSDKLLSWLAQDPDTFTRLSIAKGWAYVLVTAALLYWLIERHTRTLLDSENTLWEKNTTLSATEAELRRNMDEYYRKAAQLRLITDMIPALICYVDSTGSYRFVNRRYAQWFGKTPAEIVGRSVQEIVGPDLYAQIREPCDRALAGETLGFSETSTSVDGQERIMDVTYLPDTGLDGTVRGFVAMIQDVTERMQVQQALVESEERYRHLFENNPHPMWVYDLETLAFLAVNDAAVHHYGYGREEFLAMTIRDIRPAEDIPALLDNIAGLQGGIDAAGTWRHRKKDGTIIAVEITSHSLEWGDRPAEVVLAHDVTELLRTQAELQRLTIELEQLVAKRTAELQQVNRELEAFSYSVSHDLQAPLRHIEGFSQALREDCADRLDERGLHHLERIGGATRRMGQLIETLLQLAQLSRSELKRGSVDLSGIVAMFAEELRQSQPERLVEFRIAEGVTVPGDPRLLQVVIENLLRNAWKFTGKKDTAVIEFGTERRGGEPTYFIRDNGVGFDMAFAARLFTPFQRLHSEAEFAGSGIGLATVQRIIHRHGGRVWAEGEPGGGATFSFTLGGGQQP